uniref:Uncharacterized protein n=1 Tax=Micrurus lemniscatus lemniscatus TaxID=129467 RepID=A0A2D4HRH4_MICLE
MGLDSLELWVPCISQTYKSKINQGSWGVFQQLYKCKAYLLSCKLGPPGEEMSDNLTLPCDCRREEKNVLTAAVDQGAQGESNLAKDEMAELVSAFLPESSPASKLPLALSKQQEQQYLSCLSRNTSWGRSDRSELHLNAGLCLTSLFWMQRTSPCSPPTQSSFC